VLEAHLKIVHQTPRLVVVDKPAGLLSVPGKGEANQDCVAARVREMFPDASGPLVVHRLDMDTSGLMVLGLDAAAQRDLSMQFERRTTFKRYVAIVDGVMEAETGEVDLPMRLDVDRRPVQIVDHDHGKASLTRWRVIKNEGECSRVELEPVTGRTHQLRVHMAAIGHAILGDPLYGEQPRTRGMAPRLCLHASVLEFDDPASGERVRVRSEAEF
jgi:tRNA pseudouridine32 synthase / 23S rRNA pseudouridine746 synthase